MYHLLLIIDDRQVIQPRSQWPIPKEELHDLVAGAQVSFEPLEESVSCIWCLVSGFLFLVSGNCRNMKWWQQVV